MDGVVKDVSGLPMERMAIDSLKSEILEEVKYIENPKRQKYELNARFMHKVPLELLKFGHIADYLGSAEDHYRELAEKELADMKYNPDLCVFYFDIWVRCYDALMATRSGNVSGVADYFRDDAAKARNASHYEEGFLEGKNPFMVDSGDKLLKEVTSTRSLVDSFNKMAERYDAIASRLPGLMPKQS